MANTEPQVLGNKSTLDKAGFSAYTRDAGRKRSDVRHKAFDFSDIGLEGGSQNEGRINPYNFRKFHQTSIYVYNPNVEKFGEGFENAYSTAMITSNLPESFSYSLNSQWENPLNFGSGLFNLGAQLFANTSENTKIPSGVSRATSFKIWKGTEPMKVVIDIPVIDDNYNLSKTNLNEALEVLGSLVLPRYRDSSWGFYDPPPSPLQLRYTFENNPTEDDWKNINNSQNARIIVQLGGILLLDHCVIERVDVTYPNTKAQIRHTYRTVNKKDINYGNTNKDFLQPLLANVKITVSTIEALTYDNYYKMIWGKDQSSGTLQLDLAWLKNIKKAAYGFMAGEDLDKVLADLAGKTNNKPTGDG